jgi:hypothetical protein
MIPTLGQYMRARHLRNFRKPGRSNLHSNRRRAGQPVDGLAAVRRALLSWNRTFSKPGST